jgi:osmotically-inducible protein OsmY
MQPPDTSASATDAEPPKHGAIGHLSTEEELQQAVLKALIEDTELDSSDIGVRVARDTVTLSGSVETREAWSRASSIAKAQRGVVNVEQGELRIRRA